MLNVNIADNEIPAPQEDNAETTASKLEVGKLYTPKQHLFLMTNDAWEEFILEWSQHQKVKYHLVASMGGANDYGIDVACFYTDKGFNGKWDNYQCKYYKGDPLAPSTAIPEMGKILWHAFNRTISMPERYYFFAPKDCGPALKKLLLDEKKLKEKLFSEWENWCSNSITSTQIIELKGKFLEFVNSVDFNIFQYKPTHDVIEEHRKTPYFPMRFGGGLPDRPKAAVPPEKIGSNEARYTEQLLEAYADHKGQDVSKLSLGSFPDLEKHFHRQRQAFYHAESLRAFARDSVPPGTFEDLQDDLLTGVIDIAESDHSDGFKRLKGVLLAAQNLPLDANGLFQVLKIRDRHGVCHQLANSDDLTWVKQND